MVLKLYTNQKMETKAHIRQSDMRWDPLLNLGRDEVLHGGSYILNKYEPPLGSSLLSGRF